MEVDIPALCCWVWPLLAMPGVPESRSPGVPESRVFLVGFMAGYWGVIARLASLENSIFSTPRMG